jgi:hypothetical protein
VIAFVDFAVLVTHFAPATALHAAFGNLARYYGSIGRHKDALDLEEKVLAFYRRAIFADDPALG